MKIINKTTNTIQRFVTNLWSFDRAFSNSVGDIGLPIGFGYEIFGPSHVGKSTMTYSLAGMLANFLQKDIVLVDLEGFDPIFLETVLGATKFDGTLNIIQNHADEKALDEMVTLMTEKKSNYDISILDSIGAISPIAETEGDLGDANMGQRAKVMAQFTRKSIKMQRNYFGQKTIFMINHRYPVIGGKGFNTPGGEVKNYLAAVRIQVKRKYLKGKYEEFPDGSYIIEGIAVKNRYGIKDQKFQLFILGGYGIHPGLCAFYDAVTEGIIKRDRVFTFENNSLGGLKKIIQEARNGNIDFFTPFYVALQNKKIPDNSVESVEIEDAQED